MIQKEQWMHTIVEKLNQQFNSRLLFVGLQGSYLRGEATEASDFDVVIVLDELSAADLDAYRSIVSTMPDCEKACGFISGRAELLHWPKHEIFQFQQDTKAYWGTLKELLPPYETSDIHNSVQIAGAALYHEACHQCVFDDRNQQIEGLRALHKGAFFVLQLVEYLRSGTYHKTKAVLQKHLNDDEKNILEIGMHWADHSAKIEENPMPYYDRFLQWCKELLCKV